MSKSSGRLTLRKNEVAPLAQLLNESICRAVRADRLCSSIHGVLDADTVASTVAAQFHKGQDKFFI